MRTDRYSGCIRARDQYGRWVITASGYDWYVNFGSEDNKLCDFGDLVRFETTVDDNGHRTFRLLENISAMKREKSSKRELVVITCIHKDTGLVDIYLSSRDEQEPSLCDNCSWTNVKIDGLNLESCAVNDQLIVEIETFQEKTKIKFVKNASKDKGEYTNTIVGKLCILPKKDGFLNNLSKCVKTIVGDKVFYDVDLGDYGGDISRIGDLVEVCVHYNDKGEPVKCVVVKNTSAIARQPIENNKQKQL